MFHLEVVFVSLVVVGGTVDVVGDTVEAAAVEADVAVGASVF